MSASDVQQVWASPQRDFRQQLRSGQEVREGDDCVDWRGGGGAADAFDGRLVELAEIAGGLGVRPIDGEADGAKVQPAALVVDGAGRVGAPVGVATEGRLIPGEQRHDPGAAAAQQHLGGVGLDAQLAAQGEQALELGDGAERPAIVGVDELLSLPGAQPQLVVAVAEPHGAKVGQRQRQRRPHHRQVLANVAGDDQPAAAGGQTGRGVLGRQALAFLLEQRPVGLSVGVHVRAAVQLVQAQRLNG